MTQLAASLAFYCLSLWPLALHWCVTAITTAAMESRNLSLDLHGYRSDEAIREGKYYFDWLLLSAYLAFCNPLIIHHHHPTYVCQ